MDVDGNRVGLHGKLDGNEEGCPVDGIKGEKADIPVQEMEGAQASLDPDCVFLQIGGAEPLQKYVDFLTDKIKSDYGDLHAKLSLVEEIPLIDLITMVCQEQPIDEQAVRQAYQPVKVSEEEFDNLSASVKLCMIKQRTVFKPTIFKKVMAEFGKLRCLIEYDESADQSGAQATLYH